MEIALSYHQYKATRFFAADHWHCMYRAGCSAREAANHTLVLMSLYGFWYFKVTYNLLLAYNLVTRNVDIIYGGSLAVAMARNSVSGGRVLEMVAGDVPAEYMLAVHPTVTGAPEEFERCFFGRIREILLEAATLRWEKLPRVEVRTLLKEGDEARCGDCLKEILVWVEVVLLPCGHCFCFVCVGIWFGELGKDTCPMCRARVEASSDPYLPDYYVGDDEYDYDADDEREV